MKKIKKIVEKRIKEKPLSEWIAFKDEESCWFEGEVKKTTEMNEKIIVSVGDIMARIENSKYFNFYKSADEQKTFFMMI